MRKNSSEIASEIHRRICLNGAGNGMVLHESDLAAEFGVSRTPIRQVLQMLAYENLVETRSGVGTIVTPLVPQARERDETAFRAVLGAASSCPIRADTVPAEVHADLSGARRIIALGGNEEEAIFAALVGLLSATVSLIGDNILRSAVRAAYWRHIRWSIAGKGKEGSRKATLENLRTLLETSIVRSDELGPAGILELLSSCAV